MATQAELEARLDKLKKALASGAKSLTFESGGVTQRVDYRDVDEIKKAIASVEGELAIASGAPRIRRFVFTSDKGL